MVFFVPNKSLSLRNEDFFFFPIANDGKDFPYDQSVYFLHSVLINADQERVEISRRGE